MRKRRAQGKKLGTRAVADVVERGAGLACLLATMPLYSATVTPFQRFEGLSAWIGFCAPRMHLFALAAVVGVLIYLLAGTRKRGGGPGEQGRSGAHARTCPSRALLAGGIPVYLLSVAAFALCALGDGLLATWVIWVLAALVGVGAVPMVLAWGRAFASMRRGRATVAVAFAGLLHAAIGLAFSVMPAALCGWAFFLVACLCAGLLVCVLVRDAGGDEEGPAFEGPAGGPSSRRERLASFAQVSWPAFAGLLAFAFVTGLLRGAVVGRFDLQMGVLVVCALGLGLLAWASTRRDPISLSNGLVIPLLAMAALAAMGAFSALGAGSLVGTALTYTLYTYTALATLAMLAAVAHAGEFEPDVIFAVVLGAFCLSSLLGLECGTAFSQYEGLVTAAEAIVTAAYAVALIAPALVRASLGDRHEKGELAGEALGRGAQAAGELGGDREPDARPDDGGAAWHASTTAAVRTRCQEIADQYGLTSREREILSYVALGHSSRYISETLYISPNTVRTHIHNMYGKLGIGSREDAIALVCLPKAAPGGEQNPT